MEDDVGTETNEEDDAAAAAAADATIDNVEADGKRPSLPKAAAAAAAAPAPPPPPDAALTIRCFVEDKLPNTSSTGAATRVGSTGGCCEEEEE